MAGVYAGLPSVSGPTQSEGEKQGRHRGGTLKGPSRGGDGRTRDPSSSHHTTGASDRGGVVDGGRRLWVV